MTKLLISTAIVSLLALGGPALAQGHDDDHGHGGGGGGAPHAAPASHPAPAPHAAPARQPGGMPGHGAAGAQNMPRTDNRPDNRSQEDHRPSAGAQNAPAAQPAPHDAMRGPAAGGAMRGPAPQNAMRGPGGGGNFAAMHRNFNAPQHYHAPVYRRPAGWYSHRWTYGETLPSLFWAPDYWLNDYVDFGLEPPPPGTLWVRDGGDALLIVRGTGEIIQVEYSVFY